MRSPQDCMNKLNDLICYAQAVTREDHAKLGAMLLSAGAAFCDHGGLHRDEMIAIVDADIASNEEVKS